MALEGYYILEGYIGKLHCTTMPYCILWLPFCDHQYGTLLIGQWKGEIKDLELKKKYVHIEWFRKKKKKKRRETKFFNKKNSLLVSKFATRNNRPTEIFFPLIIIFRKKIRFLVIFSFWYSNGIQTNQATICKWNIVIKN